MHFTEPMMRPPQEATSLLLRCTQGCTYNRCHFCYVSRHHAFGAVRPEDMERDLLAAVPAHAPDTRVYLTGSNPFALPVDKLAGYLRCIRAHVPRCAAVSAQAMIRDVAAKSLEDIRTLRNLGLTELYIGVESGNDAALAMMNKGQTAAEIVTQLHKLDAAGVAYTCYYVLGLGGRGMGVESGRATARLFNGVHPKRVTTTGMTVFPAAPLWQMVQRGEYAEASEREKIEELQVFLQELDVDTHYDGVHYLNPLNYRFNVRDTTARADALADIADCLATTSDAELERMVGRALFTSL